MSYETLTSRSPSFKGDITTSLIDRVENNPFHPLAETTRWPLKYDEFVRKTNEAMGAVMVSDETGSTADILTGQLNAYHLQHIPQYGGTVQVSDGTLDTSLTNYQRGIVYFDTLPSSDTFVFTYMAEPDRYFGEYLTVLQDSIHQLQTFLGAGTEQGEGVMNAKLVMGTRSAGIASRLPHSMPLDALDEGLLVQSDPGGAGKTHRFGGAQDSLELRGQRLDVKGDSNDIDMFFGANSGDDAFFAGQVVITGDVTILGDLNVTGARVIQDGTTTVNTEVAQLKLIAEYEAILGVSSSAMTYVGGGMDVTGRFRHIGAGNLDAHFDRDIQLRDGAIRGVTHESKIDGMNPSTVEKLRPYYVNYDWKAASLNAGPRQGILTGVATNTGLDFLDITGGITALRSADPHDFGNKYQAGDYFVTFTSFPNSDAEVGKSVPVTDMLTGSERIELSRALRASPEGASFVVHHRYALPNIISDGGGLSVTINASTAQKIVGNRQGRMKVRESSTSVLSLPDDSTAYIFMKVSDGVGDIEEDEPTFFYREGSPLTGSNPEAWVESDEDVLIGKVVTAGGAISSITHFRYNYRFDSEWLKVGGGSPISDGAQFQIDHLFGNALRMQDVWPFSVSVTDSTGDLPNLSTIRVGHLTVSAAAAAVGEFQLIDITPEQATVDLPTAANIGLSTPFWVRVKMG